MSPRSQSGYDPVGDPRTGRPPLPDERERLRQATPDETGEMELGGSSDASVSGGEDQQGGSQSMIRKIATGSAEATQTLKSAKDAVTTQVSEATSAALERGQALATTASEEMRTYIDQFVSFARRRPLAAVAGAAVLGLLVGLFRRGRARD
jgi:ElaB/YqjD/DUF883 family membrane-anchored ribosome-binding protein